MAGETGIEWCDSTFNPWIGCTQVSPACDHCYAAVSTPARALGVEWGAGKQRRRTSEGNWKLPLRWDRADFRECGHCGWRGEIDTLVSDECPACSKHQRLEPARRRVFCASLADVFDNEVPAQWREDLFALIRATPNLDWLLLTKRIGNADRMIADAVGALPRDARSGTGQHNHTPMAEWPWPNVWLGATICNQAEADRDIPKLLRTPAAVRFLSVEPMLGPIDLSQACAGFMQDFAVMGDAYLHWIIAGGESGPHSRPMHPDWARLLRDQCALASVPFLFKQWGEHAMTYDRDRDDPDWRRCAEWDRKPGRWINLAGGHGFHGDRVHYAHRVGKKASGRLLDGQTHTEFPNSGERTNVR